MMYRHALTASLVAALATTVTAGAQGTATQDTTKHTGARAGATKTSSTKHRTRKHAKSRTTRRTSAGEVDLADQPTLIVLVDPSVASTARLTADSAYGIARTRAHSGQINRAQLGNTNNRLVYDMLVLDPTTNEVAEVVVDAMSGQVLDAKSFGTLRGAPGMANPSPGQMNPPSNRPNPSLSPRAQTDTNRRTLTDSTQRPPSDSTLRRPMRDSTMQNPTDSTRRNPPE